MTSGNILTRLFKSGVVDSVGDAAALEFQRYLIPGLYIGISCFKVAILLLGGTIEGWQCRRQFH
jgi:hypothetical protein